MNTECLYKYLKELSRCEWLDNATANGIKYNGIDITYGANYYSKLLAEMQSNAEMVLLDYASNDKTQILTTLYNKVKEIYEFPYDIVDMEYVNALKRDSIGNQNKNDIELGYYVIEMHGTQRYFQKSLLDFIGNLLNIPERQEKDVASQLITTEQDSAILSAEKEDTRIIKGVKGLARHLGIGVTKAQEILNSGILHKNGTAYRNGKAWRINTEKLNEIIAQNPNIFK